jgi:hypothetical protein
MNVPPAPEGQPKSRNWLVVIVAVVVFCCLCSLCGLLFWYLYSFGDQLFGLAARVAAGAM